MKTATRVGLAVGAVAVAALVWWRPWSASEVRPAPTQLPGASGQDHAVGFAAQDDGAPAAPFATDSQVVRESLPLSQVALQTFRGIVEDREGGAIVRATVSLFLGGLEAVPPHATVTTDRRGRFQCAAPTGTDPWLLRASAPGYTVQSLDVTPEGTAQDLVFVLSPTARMVVRVNDCLTDLPIAEARVGAADSRTGSDGRATIDVVTGDDLDLRVEAEGYCALRWRGTMAEATQAELPLPMTRAARVLGRVTDERGQPLAALVQVRIEAPNDRWQEVEQPRRDPAAKRVRGTLRDELEPASTKCDEHGRFELLVRPEIPWQSVVASLPDRVPARSSELAPLAPGDAVQVDLVLAIGGAVRGRVLCNGEAARGLLVWRSAAGPSGSHLVDQAGGYSFRGLPTGAIDLSFRQFGAGQPVATAHTFVVAGQEVVQDLTWSETTATLAGRVTSSNGQPVVGARVIAQSEQRTQGLVATRSDQNGQWSLRVPAPSLCSVSVVHDGLTRRREGVAAGATGIDFVLPDMGRLALQLVDERTGEPVRGRTGSNGEFAWRELAAGPFRRVRGRLDHTGRVVLSLPIGSVDLRVDLHDHGYRPLERTGVAVVADDGPGGELVLALQRGAELHLGVRGDADFTAEVRKGHVFFVLHDTQVDAVRGPFPPGSDQSNFEIDGLHVWLRDRWLLDQMPAFTGEDCSTLNGLTPGTYRLAAFPDDLLFEPATFAVGENGADVELRWRRR